jgi:hypothetical protein
MGKGKMTMAEWERSPMDKKKDVALKKKGIKEGSAKDMEMDKKALAAYNAKMAKVPKAKKK